MTSIDTNINDVNQSCTQVTVNLVSAVKLVDADADRLVLRVSLPIVGVTTEVVVAGTETEANNGCGEILEVDTSGNTNLFDNKVTFDTNSAAQGEKWAFMVLGPTTLDLNINEYAK